MPEEVEKLKIEMYRTLADNQTTVRGLMQELIDEGVFFSLRQGPVPVGGDIWQASYRDHHAVGKTKGEALMRLGMHLQRVL